MTSSSGDWYTSDEELRLSEAEQPEWAICKSKKESKKRQICKFNLQNSCRFGARCLNEHATGSSNNKNVSTNKNNSKNGSLNEINQIVSPPDELCKYFLKGSCKFVMNCKYKHDNSDGNNNDNNIDNGNRKGSKLSIGSFKGSDKYEDDDEETIELQG